MDFEHDATSEREITLSKNLEKIDDNNVSNKYKKLDIIDAVTEFAKAADIDVENFNSRNAALYTGLQCEEFAEKIKELLFMRDMELEYINMVLLNNLIMLLDIVGNKFKSGKFDSIFNNVSKEKLRVSKKMLLDADIDLLWVTIGSALSQGADVRGACAEITRSNMSKLGSDGKMIKDSDGKVIKPAHYSPPDLLQFICK